MNTLALSSGGQEAYPLGACVNVCTGYELQPRIRGGKLHVLSSHKACPDVIILAAQRPKFDLLGENPWLCHEV